MREWIILRYRTTIKKGLCKLGHSPVENGHLWVVTLLFAQALPQFKQNALLVCCGSFVSDFKIQLTKKLYVFITCSLPILNANFEFERKFAEQRQFKYNILLILSIGYGFVPFCTLCAIFAPFEILWGGGRLPVS